MPERKDVDLKVVDLKVRRTKVMRIGNWLTGVSKALTELAEEVRASGCTESAWLIEVAALSVAEAALSSRDVSGMHKT